MSTENENANGAGTPGDAAAFGATSAASPPAASTAEGAGAAAEPARETPEQTVTRLEREKAETHDRMLRIAADFENYKRRSKREQDDAAIRAKEGVLKEVLPVLDNLDRALQATSRGGSVEALAQGVKLVEKQLLTGLEKFGIKSFESKGQPFDPARHEAIQQIETAEFSPGVVAEEFARGYFIGERLLRPAMVAVAKAPSAPPPAAPPTGDGDGGAGKAE